jgi:hypothetical protein
VGGSPVSSSPLTRPGFGTIYFSGFELAPPPAPEPPPPVVAVETSQSLCRSSVPFCCKTPSLLERRARVPRPRPITSLRPQRPVEHWPAPVVAEQAHSP